MRYCPTCQKQFEGELDLCPEDGVALYVVPESAAERHVGRVLDGRWRLETLVGEGAMGAVYRAVQNRTGQVAAIKIIQARSFDETELVSRFFREAQVLSSLQHPHIVKLLDFGQDADTELFFIAMELLQGLPLSEAAADLSLAEIVGVMEQLADALAQTHAQGIVHRDLKPENLFVNRLRGGGVHLTVLDFGIAKIDEGQMAKLTATGSIQGTPHYMAPEQIQGKGVSALTDIYSLGCILYELLAGREPFEGETVMAVLLQHLHGSAAPLTTTWNRPEPPHPELIALTQSLMAREPTERPPDALSVHAALRGIRMSLQTASLSGETPRVTPVALPSPPPRPPPPASTAPVARGTLVMAITGFLSGLAMLGSVGWYMAQPESQTATVVAPDSGVADAAADGSTATSAAVPAEDPAVVMDFVDAGPTASDVAVPALPVAPADSPTDPATDAGQEQPPSAAGGLKAGGKKSAAGKTGRGRGRGKARDRGKGAGKGAGKAKDKGNGLGSVLDGMRRP
jgi:eukaryotic-like serine/threonine-protein kinase